MWRSYVTTAWRNLKSNALFSSINVLGLAAGLAVCLLVVALIWDQLRYDTFHPSPDRIVRVLTDRMDDGESSSTLMAAVPAPLAPAMDDQVPGIERTVRVGQIRTLAIHDGRGVSAEGLYAEPAFFDVFGFSIETGGDPEDALAQPNQLLITSALAQKLFGEASPIGKTVELESHTTFTVAGVVAEPPGETHLKFDLLASLSTLEQLPRGAQLTDWKNTWTFATYARLANGADVEQVESVLDGIAERQYADDESTIRFEVQRLSDIALGPQLANEIASYSMPATFIYILGGLALLVMLAAGFNYVSLSVARALSRSHEVGVRKTVGASRHQIMGQLMTEAVMVALLALVLALLFLAWILPAFNQLTPMQLLEVSVSPFDLVDPRLLGLCIGVTLIVGLLAGLYPALRLSGVKPVGILSSSRSASIGSSQRLRTALAGLQFGLAVVFATLAMMLASQSRFMTDADYGFRMDDRLTTAVHGQSVETLKAELSSHSAVEDVTFTSTHPVSGSVAGADLAREGRDPVSVYRYPVDASFVKVMGLELVAGRDFVTGEPTDSTGALVLNQKAVGALGFASAQEAVGRTVTFLDEPHEIAGVVEDYHIQRLSEPIRPVVLYHSPSGLRNVIVAAVPGQMDAARTHVKAVWEKLDPVREIEVASLTQTIVQNPLNNVIREAASLVGVLSVLAILISSLGLLGMAVHSVERRRKEVGIRKTLGASRRALVWLMSRRFVWLIVVTSVIALPLAWALNSAWLQLFAHRVSVTPWHLGAAALALGAVAVVVVATQTYRAAGTDPSLVLRTE